MREIVFDTETTGLDPKTGDRIVEIGCLEMINRVETGKTYHTYFNPERDMPSAAEAVHGLSISFLETKPKFSEVVEELLDFLGDSPLVAHNASFDIGFLNHELLLCGRDLIDQGRMVDTVTIARKKHPGARVSLDALCTRYGVDRSHRVKHGALLDAELLAQVYVELMGGRQIGLGLSENTQSESPTTVNEKSNNVSRPKKEPREHSASEEELVQHKVFLRKIKNPLWLEQQLKGNEILTT